MTIWKTLNCFVDIRSPWLRLIGENLEDNQGRVLEYWRVEKADSVVIITIQGDRLLLPTPIYRPGIGETTLDFPGGRVPPGKTPLEVVPDILKKELGITEDAIASINPMNTKGWAINSSFSNQRLYGFVAEIFAKFVVNSDYVTVNYSNNDEGIKQLLEQLTCLQCRGLLLEWIQRKERIIPTPSP